jgi:hypothetical protein
MVRCTTLHTCRKWKWILSCIIPWLLIVMEYHRSYSSSVSSSTLSFTSIANLISSRCIVLWHLVILHEIILWLCGNVLQLHSFILLWCNFIWGWYLVKLWCKFIWGWYLFKLWCDFHCHHLYLHPIGV